jgi:hypothetical protein
MVVDRKDDACSMHVLFIRFDQQFQIYPLRVLNYLSLLIFITIFDLL